MDEFYAAVIEPHRLSTALALCAGMLEADLACLLVKDFTSASARTRVYEQSRPSEVRLAQTVKLDEGLVEAISVEILPGQERVVCGGRAAGHNAGVSTLSSAKAHSGRSNYIALTVKGGAWLSFSLVALRGRIPFADTDRQRMEALLPDIRRALSLKQMAEKPDASVSIRLRDETPIAVLTVRDKVLEQANASARALLDNGRVIAALGGVLRFSDKRTNAAFDALSKSIGRSRLDSTGRASAIVMRADGGAWIVQFSEAENGQDTKLAARPSAPAMIIVLTPFDAASRSRSAVLNGFANLTPTERAILSAFVDGRGISSIAAATNRSVETVRWHVRNLFRKIGVNTQADLARLGALLLPL